jgi:predicted Fe-Mo cluster-binding NifX family protein
VHHRNRPGAIKIAAATNDGNTIASHFGMAAFYQVIVTEAGKIKTMERRPKPHHTTHPNLAQAQNHDHEDMLAPIRDCQILLCGGMRTFAYENAEAAGLHVIMTGGLIEDAVRGYLSGNLVSDPRLIRKL